MVLPFFFPATLILRFAGSEGAKNLAGQMPPPDSNPFSDAESGKISLGCQAAKTATPNRRFQFHKRSQDFIGTHNETLSVVAMCVCNPDRSPLTIHG